MLCRLRNIGSGVIYNRLYLLKSLLKSLTVILSAQKDVSFNVAVMNAESTKDFIYQVKENGVSQKKKMK